jgi:hypothetical protein
MYIILHLTDSNCGMEVNFALRLKPVSTSTMMNLRQAEFSECRIKPRGDMFARCGVCDNKRKLIDSHLVRSTNYALFDKAYKVHLAEQEAHRNAYYGTRYMSISHPGKYVTIIHDKMDHAKTASPCFASKNKSIDAFMRLPVAVTGMIAHGHGDGKYAHFSLDLYPCDSNHTMGSVAKLLHDLEKQPACSSGILFENLGATSLFAAVLSGKESCVSALGTDLVPLVVRRLPPILHVQLDNCWKDNKSRYVFCFWSLLVAKGISEEVFVLFLLVGHTHEDIDATFGRWSMKLHENDYPTLPSLMKSFMLLDPNSQKIIPSLIEEVPEFKDFIKPFIASGRDKLIGHTRGQQFKFSMHNGEPIMQYKILCTDLLWKPDIGINLWKLDSDGKQVWPHGEPTPAPPIPMKKEDNIIKGLSSFIDLWESLAQRDHTGSYGRSHGDFIMYWKGVRDALKLPPPPLRASLVNGFWPSTRIQTSDIVPLSHDGIVREEFVEDEPFIGPMGEQPRPSFQVARDVYEGYMLLIRLGDEVRPKPVWVCVGSITSSLDIH